MADQISVQKFDQPWDSQSQFIDLVLEADGEDQ